MLQSRPISLLLEGGRGHVTLCVRLIKQQDASYIHPGVRLERQEEDHEEVDQGVAQEREVLPQGPLRDNGPELVLFAGQRKRTENMGRESSCGKVSENGGKRRVGIDQQQR